MTSSQALKLGTDCLVQSTVRFAMHGDSIASSQTLMLRLVITTSQALMGRNRLAGSLVCKAPHASNEGKCPCRERQRTELRCSAVRDDIVSVR